MSHSSPALTDPPRSVALTVRELTRSFGVDGGTLEAVRDLSFEVAAGEILCVVGPSGCGKTTLLRILAGLLPPSRGEVEIVQDGSRPRLAMVFQEHGLMPWLDVLGNVSLGLRPLGLDGRERERRALHIIEQVGLAGFERFLPDRLSGGMQQRVAIARAFAVDPQVLMLDEPFVFLDAPNRLHLLALLQQLWARTRPTIVFITHDIQEAILLADRVLVLTKHPGRIKSIVPIDLPRPRDFLRLFRDPEALRIATELSGLLEGDGAGAREDGDG